MADDKFREVGTTNGGKAIGFKPASNAALYQICFGSGGELHESLKGSFTTPREAEIAINNYLNNHQKPAAKKPAAKKKVA